MHERLVTLGDDVDTGQPVTVDQVSLCSGSYILGAQGTGKSSLLEQIAFQQLELGDAVIVFDAHGDLIDDIIRRMPASRLQDAYILDLEDCWRYPFGLNVFSCRDSSEKARVRTRNLVVHAFEKLWPETERQQYFPQFLNAVTMTLIELPHLTLRHVPDLLDDPVFRGRQVAALKDADARQFWRDYERMTQSTRNTESAPFRKRLAQLRRDTLVRLLLFQPGKVIDIKRAIEERQVLLIKLPVGPEYGQTAQTVGTLLMALVYAATFSFGDRDEDQRPGFTLLVDEFQEFATDEFAVLFTQGRKYRVKQFLAHQQRGQLDDAGMTANKPAALTAFTRVAFRLIEPDARELASAFADLEDRRRPVNLAIDVLPRLKTHSAPAVKDFALKYVRPLEDGTTDRIGTRREWVPSPSSYDRRHDRGWVSHIPVYPRSDFGCGVVSFLPEYVEHAYDVLNEYLYYAQAHGRPAPVRHKQLLATLAPLLRFPAVAALAFPEFPVDKNRWSGDDWSTEYRQARLWEKSQWPWAEQETHYKRFLHELNRCVYELLRQPLTLRDSGAGQTEAKTSLQKLDQRMAYVKLGSQTYVMQTLDLAQTAPAVSDAEYQRRRQQILTQTRARYCRPRAEVEAELQADVASPETPPPAETPPPLPKAADSPKAPRIRRSRPSSDNSDQP